MHTAPRHIAIIPDGNRRWAKQHMLLPWKGHERGAERFDEIVTALFEQGIPYVTLWAASEDNLRKRSKREITFLVSLLQNWLQKEFNEKRFLKRDIKFRFIGQWRPLLPDNSELAAVVEKLERQTECCGKRNLTVLFGYDGQNEMIEAIKKIKGDANAHAIKKEDLQRALWTGELPPVDLVIRTGGEPHWSAGFMMWHTANSQFYFTRTLWPQFGRRELKAALEDFSKRGRRFGA